MATYFDSSLSDNYVFMYDNSGLTQGGSIPVESMVQLDTNGDYVITPLVGQMIPFTAIGVDFDSFIPALEPIPSTDTEKLVVMCGLFKGTNNP